MKHGFVVEQSGIIFILSHPFKVPCNLGNLIPTSAVRVMHSGVPVTTEILL